MSEELFARMSHPETSHAAMAAYPQAKLDSGVATCVAIHKEHGPIADFEYFELWQGVWKTPCAVNLYRQSRNAACKKGLIRDSGQRRINPMSGRDQVVWEACEIAPPVVLRCESCGGVLSCDDEEAA